MKTVNILSIFAIVIIGCQAQGKLRGQQNNPRRLSTKALKKVAQEKMREGHFHPKLTLRDLGHMYNNPDDLSYVIQKSVGTKLDGLGR